MLLLSGWVISDLVRLSCRLVVAGVSVHGGSWLWQTQFSHVAISSPRGCANAYQLHTHTITCSIQLQVIYSTSEQKHSQTLIYLSVCVGESTKQQRGDDVPRQTLCGVGGLLNAVPGSRCGRVLHLSASLSSPLRSSIPRSCRHYRCHQIATMQEKPWSGPHVPHSLPERARERARARQTVRRENHHTERGGMDC